LKKPRRRRASGREGTPCRGQPSPRSLAAPVNFVFGCGFLPRGVFRKHGRRCSWRAGDGTHQPADASPRAAHAHSCAQLARPSQIQNQTNADSLLARASLGPTRALRETAPSRVGSARLVVVDEQIDDADCSLAKHRSGTADLADHDHPIPAITLRRCLPSVHVADGRLRDRFSAALTGRLSSARSSQHRGPGLQERPSATSVWLGLCQVRWPAIPRRN
jgi:hypothetical protein